MSEGVVLCRCDVCDGVLGSLIPADWSGVPSASTGSLGSVAGGAGAVVVACVHSDEKAFATVISKISGVSWGMAPSTHSS